MQVVLATGRRYSRTLPLVEPLGIDVPLITAGGALIKDPLDHRTFYQAEFEAALLKRMCRLLDRLGYDPLLCADTFLENFDYYHAVEAEKARRWELAEYWNSIRRTAACCPKSSTSRRRACSWFSRSARESKC